ncbi:hypothetical protein [Saccharothrix lopnurensis]|uniref:Uncharacterized protein n=1 Tax=Saccharothrix lopnurensis TaxID=1670621 RepID=A0ABW1P6I6_9PSEU
MRKPPPGLAGATPAAAPAPAHAHAHAEAAVPHAGSPDAVPGGYVVKPADVAAADRVTARYLEADPAATPARARADIVREATPLPWAVGSRTDPHPVKPPATPPVNPLPPLRKDLPCASSCPAWAS